MLKSLTEQYISAFNDKNLDKVAALLDEKFSLEDPVVKRIEGKSECLKAIDGIFKSCKKLSFSAKNIYAQNNTSLIEFVLKLDETTLKGVDILEWQDDKILNLRAYLDIPKA